MLDPFGNYLCQKLYENANLYKKTKILMLMESEMCYICCNVYGTRVAQKIINISTDASLIRLLSKMIQPYLAQLCVDQHGCHVLQRCLVVWGKAEQYFDFFPIKHQSLKINMSRWGCCVYQRCMDYVSLETKIELAKAVINEIYTLVKVA